MIVNVAGNPPKMKSLINTYKIGKVSETPAIVKTKQQIYSDIRDKMADRLKEAFDPTSKMSDEEKKNYEEKINQKIKNGDKLTSSEMQYIRLKSPYLYAMISRIQFQRQVLEEKLKQCRSKEEVEEVYNSSISHISKKDPAKEPLMAAYTKVTLEFKKSSTYKNLPQKVEKEDETEKEQLELWTNSQGFQTETEKRYQVEDTNSVIDIKA